MQLSKGGVTVAALYAYCRNTLTCLHVFMAPSSYLFPKRESNRGSYALKEDFKSCQCVGVLAKQHMRKPHSLLDVLYQVPNWRLTDVLQRPLKKLLKGLTV